jgi:hypothetical protein
VAGVALDVAFNSKHGFSQPLSTPLETGPHHLPSRVVVKFIKAIAGLKDKFKRRASFLFFEEECIAAGSIACGLRFAPWPG